MRETGERTYKIGEFAAMTGMTPSKVRFYDKAGLFESTLRDESGYRAFTPHDAFRANAFRVLLQYGFTVERAIAVLDERQGTVEFEESLKCLRYHRRLTRAEKPGWTRCRAQPGPGGRVRKIA